MLNKKLVINYKRVTTLTLFILATTIVTVSLDILHMNVDTHC